MKLHDACRTATIQSQNHATECACRDCALVMEYYLSGIAYQGGRIIHLWTNYAGPTRRVA
jgi:hypothetical protein